MSPENSHKLMMEVSILGVILQYMLSAKFFKLFPISCIGFIIMLCVEHYVYVINKAGH